MIAIIPVVVAGLSATTNTFRYHAQLADTASAVLCDWWADGDEMDLRPVWGGYEDGRIANHAVQISP
jgi:hypothetical protein